MDNMDISVKKVHVQVL